MLKVTEKYGNFIKLERSKGYQNTAIMGGFGALANTWPSEARESGLSESLISKVSQLLKKYESKSPEDRRKDLIELTSWLGLSEIGSFPPAPDGNPAPKPVSQPDTKPVTSTPAARKTGQSNPPGRTKKSETPAKPSQPQIGLDASVEVIRGVGENQVKNLAKLEIFTIRDLLYHFPRRYDDYSKLKTINQLRVGEEATIVASVNNIVRIPTRKGKTLIEAVVSDATGSMRLLWFNQEWHMRSLRQDMMISISGRIDLYLGRPVIWHPEYEPIDQQQLNTNRIVPVYPLTAKVTQKWLRRTIFSTLKYWIPRISETLTDQIQQHARVIGLRQALNQVHFPDDMQALTAAQRRLAFDELFIQQLGIILQKRQWLEMSGKPYPVTDTWLQARIDSLPYELTSAQLRTIDEIRKDVSSAHPMNRLLQGDVGSGKTIVALVGMAMIISHGAQAAFMAPTGILAEQHYQTSLKLMTESKGKQAAFLEPGQVRLLTGDTSTADRKEIAAGLKNGYIKLLIGTHALIEDPVKFQNLQMAVVDEQHRFGVAQRAALRNKGDNPHLLVMTATPIPRSLQLTVFGGLDVSVMDEMPKGRLPITTSIAFPTERERVYDRIRDEVELGHQAFIIYPLVEAGENDEVKAAVEEQERLQKEVFTELRVGLVHGRLKPAEKDAVMLSFRKGVFDILVSTSVVEVGVDIPNASIMIIEGANRFGLAQLHQFRGRVGRGDAPSYCFLIPDTEDAAENNRLLIMTQTNDGFVLAEQDLRDRGPGDFLGTRQAGFNEFKMASLADVRLIHLAREVAEEVLEADPGLESTEHLPLKQAVEKILPSDDGEGDVS
ncbi:MAG TPA: ATP-dependent DNA helicase RecG [Anaerolineaceae bacterium]|nr:ATP-dependent DNA helicase RecG [Anaerolineaceae bacterium]